MRALLALAVLALALAGCIARPAAIDPAAAEPAAGQAADAGEPFVLEWSGHVLASAVDLPSHVRPTEDLLWAVQQEGFLLELPAVPAAMEVALRWEGSGRFMIMLHSHKDHGSNVYVEHVTAMGEANPQCLRVPPEDLAEGTWQVMVHNEEAVNVPFTLTVRTWGVEGAVGEDLHGHWIQDGAFEVDVHEILPCEEPPAQAGADGARAA